MIRRRRRTRNSPAVHKTSRRTEIVLAGVAADAGTGEVSHVVIELSDAPGEALVQDHIDATAGDDGEAALGAHTDQRRPAMRAAEEELRERHEVIKFAPVHPGTKQVTDDRAVGGSSIEVAIFEARPSQLRG